MNNQPNKSGTPPIVPLGPRRGGPMSARATAEKPKNTRRTLLRLTRYIGRSRYLLIALLVLTLLLYT